MKGIRNFVLNNYDLNDAVKYGWHDRIKFLLSKAVSVEKGPPGKQCPMHMAIAIGDVKATELFLDHGADKKFYPSFEAFLEEFRPLETAVIEDRPEIVKLLARKGLDVNRRFKDASIYHKEMYFLHYAVYMDSLEMVKCLLKCKANVNALDDKDRSALFIAVKKDRYQIAKLLLRNGAQISMKNDALYLAARLFVKKHNNNQTYELLYKHIKN